MARWIDKIALWLFASAAALAFAMTVTGGNMLGSILTAFAVVMVLGAVVDRIPDKRMILRGERKRRSRNLIRKWALADSETVLDEMKKLIPELICEGGGRRIVLVQMIPGAGKLDENQLLRLWKDHRGTDGIMIISTADASDGARALSEELKGPDVSLTDCGMLIRRLCPVIHRLPDKEIKNERRISTKICIARLIREIRPVRTGVYAAVSLAFFLLTRSKIYLTGFLLMGGLIAVSCLCRRRSGTA